MTDEPLIDPSGWESWTEADGTMTVKVIVTSRARRAMSPRQLADLEAGGSLIAAAFSPDEPIAYADAPPPQSCPHGVLPAACPFCVKRQEAAAKPVPSWVDEAEAALARAAASGQDVEAARRDLDAIEAAANLKHGTGGEER